MLGVSHARFLALLLLQKTEDAVHTAVVGHLVLHVAYWMDRIDYHIRIFYEYS